MKMLKTILLATLLAGFAVPFATLAADLKDNAADQKDKPAAQKEKPKPYTLKKCVVSGDKLGEMGDPYVFVHEGREIKLCCKSCLKDFNKSPAKFLKKIDEEEAKAKKEKALKG
ncbi:MAG TPA: hypothetical protein VN578_00510 [Candidatus Binatia bacterium]|jgi:hypothetical protein|nr:hypothetical protein [Candidatus Binatia bacterium]